MINTHEKYDTINHLHFYSFDKNDTYIGFLGVECKNGKWFLEWESNTNESLVKSLPDIAYPFYDKDSFIEPTFYNSEEEMQSRATYIENFIKSNLI